MKLFCIAIAMPEEKEFWFGLYFAIDLSEEAARETAISHFIATHPDLEILKDFVIEILEVPVDEDMLPKIAQNIKARKVLEGTVNEDLLPRV